MKLLFVIIIRNNGLAIISFFQFLCLVFTFKNKMSFSLFCKGVGGSSFNVYFSGAEELSFISDRRELNSKDTFLRQLFLKKLSILSFN